MKANKAFTHFVLCLFSVFLVCLAVAQEQEVPADSISSEVSSSNDCAEGLVPITKAASSELVCVKPESVTKLIYRGWGIAPMEVTEVKTETGSETSVEATSETDSSTKADRVFLSGVVYTVDENNPWAEAVAIQDGKITYVGDDEGAQDFIGEDTQVTDLTGKMLLPGFHDNHAHPYGMSLTLMRCDLFEGYSSKEDYLKQIEQCAEEQEDKKSLTGVGYWLGNFPEDDRPNRYDLDKISPDKPAWFMDVDGHSFWINSKTLELSNIDKDTPDPEGGIIERDENGEPTGLLIGEAWVLVPDELWQLEELEGQEGVRRALAMLSSAGVTSVVDAQAIDESYDKIYISLAESGKLNLRVDAALWVDPNKDDEEQIADLISRSTKSPSSRVNFSQVKFYIDGYTGNETGLLFEPYYKDGELTDNFGDQYFEPDRLNNLVTEFEKAGFQIHMHVDGDKATHVALNAFEAARDANDMGDRRHTLTHLSLVDPDDIPRLKELDIIANIQGFWGFPELEEGWLDELIAPKIGIERANKMYPFRSLDEAGTRIVASSDWPVSTHEPLLAIEVAIRRQDPTDDSPDARSLNPEEGLDLETMLVAYTINGAYFMQQEDVTGSIEVGKHADLVVLDQNLFEIPVHKISDTQVLLTLLEGEEVYNYETEEVNSETDIEEANLETDASIEEAGSEENIEVDEENLETSVEVNETSLENDTGVNEENLQTTLDSNEEDSEVNSDVVQAEKVFLSGAVYTVDESDPWAEAVAIQDGKITYVGDNEGVQDFIGEDTQVTDLTGKMLMPGFHDAHAHPLDMALGIMGCDLFDTYGKEEYLDYIEQCAEEQQDREVVIGLGFWLDAFEEGDMPNRHQLDELVPDKPATFMDGNGHAVWVNSIVLENAGIDKDTPDPDGGIIERDEEGEPTGLLHHTAMNLVPDVAIQAIQVERVAMLEAAKEAFAMLSSAGITSMVEAQALAEDYDEFYRELDAEGELNLRMDLALWFRSNEEDDLMVEELIGRFSNDPNSRVNTNQVKFLIDGTVENGTGALLEPYYDEDGEITDNKGLLTFEAERLADLFTQLEQAGFQIHTHINGDRAARMTLDAFETARNTNQLEDTRHTMAHLILVNPDDIPRFKNLDVIPNFQLYWGYPDEEWFDPLVIPVLGEERAQQAFPFRNLHESGATLVAGSDWPVTTHEPLPAIEVALRRQDPFDDSPDAPSANPDQNLDLEAILAAYTINGAYLMQQEDVIGSIEVGKYADLVVLDQNLFEIPVHEISDTQVLLTLLEGEEVYRNKDFQ